MRLAGSLLAFYRFRWTQPSRDACRPTLEQWLGHLKVLTGLTLRRFLGCEAVSTGADVMDAKNDVVCLGYPRLGRGVVDIDIFIYRRGVHSETNP